MLSASEDFLIEAARDEMSRCWPKPTVAAVCAALDAVFVLADGTWTARRSNLRYLLDAPVPACKAGCGWCCHQQVGVSVPEAIRIAVHINALPQADGAVIGARVAHTAERSRDMDTLARARAHLACPFLGAAGNCMIYAVRPLRCRSLYSIDVDFCIACYEDHDGMQAKLRRGELKPVFLDTPARIFDSALMGVLKAMGKAAPKAVVSLEMVSSVAALLERPDLAGRWLGGLRPDKRLHLAAAAPL